MIPIDEAISCWILVEDPEGRGKQCACKNVALVSTHTATRSQFGRVLVAAISTSAANV